MSHDNSKKKKQELLIEALEKSSDDKVISMLIDLKEHGELFYLQPLLTMMVSNRGETLKKSLVEFISDIKLQDAVPIIADFVRAQSTIKEITGILTASWQSRLDFSQHLAPFFQVLIHSDYKNAFEAFTVIENSIDGLAPNVIVEFIAEIKGGLGKSNHDKQLLLLEMISVLEKTRRAAK
jgi:hypothetical protein